MTASKTAGIYDHPYLADYEVGKLLGVGSYSTVRLAINKITKKKYALKIYNKMKNIDLFRKKNLKVEILKKIIILAIQASLKSSKWLLMGALPSLTSIFLLVPFFHFFG